MCKADNWFGVFTLQTAGFAGSGISMVLAVIAAVYPTVLLTITNGRNMYDSEVVAMYISAACVVVFFTITVLLLIASLWDRCDILALSWLLGMCFIFFNFYILYLITDALTLLQQLLIEGLFLLVFIVALYVWLGVLNYYWMLRKKRWNTAVELTSLNP